ncbi:N-acetylglucosamine-6-phosphate deacetylase [Halioxenophilus aromaticivorans]|uniref:N-acetylgalactosamine-6-phosphate deacetylase n=1 Tax=Halioxenophilus aromaticivorans TaxID=1306992 RepID=A0AAV3U1U4_9ALTE
MLSYWAETLFNGEEFLSSVEIIVDNGFITSITEQPAGEGHTPLPGIVVPGLVDLQVNGGGGKLFCQEPTIATLSAMVDAHFNYGTRHLLATVITSDWPILQAAAQAVADYINQGKAGVLGVHFEGPHLGKERAGIHNKQRFVGLSDKHLALYTQKILGKVMVTLAPEIVPPDVIKDLVRQGVTVSLGHSNTNYDTALAAIEAGATSVTHLFNAMSALQSRAPGMVGAALASDSLYAGIIADGHHVHPAAIKTAVKALGEERAYLVTDAMAHVGSEQIRFGFEDQQIVKANGKLTVADGTLAGSCLDMQAAVKNCAVFTAVSPAAALKMATSTPARCIGLSQRVGFLKPGYPFIYHLLSNNFFA